MSDASWMTDPFGRHDLRFWDGQRWTEHVSDGGIAAVDAPVPPPPPSNAPSRTSGRSALPMQPQRFNAETRGMNATGMQTKFQPVQVVVTSEAIEISGSKLRPLSFTPEDIIGAEEADIRWNGTGIGMTGLTRSLGSKMNQNNAHLNSVDAPGVVLETRLGDIGLFFAPKDASDRRGLFLAIGQFADLDRL